jgi:hypothetical protein
VWGDRKQGSCWWQVAQKTLGHRVSITLLHRAAPQSTCRFDNQRMPDYSSAATSGSSWIALSHCRPLSPAPCSASDCLPLTLVCATSHCALLPSAASLRCQRVASSQLAGRWALPRQPKQKRCPCEHSTSAATARSLVTTELQREREREREEGMRRTYQSTKQKVARLLPQLFSAILYSPGAAQHGTCTHTCTPVLPERNPKPRRRSVASRRLTRSAAGGSSARWTRYRRGSAR